MVLLSTFLLLSLFLFPLRKLMIFMASKYAEQSGHGVPTIVEKLCREFYNSIYIVCKSNLDI